MTLSGEGYEWHISGTVGGTTLEVFLDVLTSYEWPRPEPSRKALDPCGGAPTLIYRTDGTLPRRSGAPQFRIDGDDPEADDVLAALQTIYALRGPWLIETPTESFAAVVDPTVGGWRDLNAGWARLVSFGWQEVDS